MDKIAAVAEHNLRLERQLSDEFSAELCSRTRSTNDKRPRRTHTHDIVGAQFSCEDAWAERSVSTNIDTSEENDESHAEDYEEKRRAPLCQVLDRTGTTKRLAPGF
jgi:hypothetical protein